MKQSGSIASSLAAIGSMLAATSCCLPLGTLWLAATFAGAGAVLDRFRPLLAGISVALIVFGFWQARRARSCSPGRRRINLALLFVAAFFTGASLLLPAYFTLGGHATPAGQAELMGLTGVDVVREQWNASPTTTNVLVLLSPT